MSYNPLPSNVEFDIYQRISTDDDYTNECDEEYNENYSFLKKQNTAEKIKTKTITILKPEKYLDD